MKRRIDHAAGTMQGGHLIYLGIGGFLGFSYAYAGTHPFWRSLLFGAVYAAFLVCGWALYEWLAHRTWRR